MVAHSCHLGTLETDTIALYEPGVSLVYIVSAGSVSVVSETLSQKIDKRKKAKKHSIK